MGCFLLNELGEVLLELASGLDFRADLRLEIDENEHEAFLRSDKQSFKVGFVHEDLLLPLKRNRQWNILYLMFFPLHTGACTVLFIL